MRKRGKNGARGVVVLAKVFLGMMGRNEQGYTPAYYQANRRDQENLECELAVLGIKADERNDYAAIKGGRKTKRAVLLFLKPTLVNNESPAP